MAILEGVELVDEVLGVVEEEVSTSLETATRYLLRQLLSMPNKLFLHPHGPVLNLPLKAQHQRCPTLASKFLVGLNHLLRAMLQLFHHHLLGGQLHKVNNRLRTVDLSSTRHSSLR